MLERVWKEGDPPTLLVGMQIGSATMENSMEVPWKVLELPYDPAIPLLGLYPEKSMVHAPQIIAAVFIIAKLWKQTKCPSTEEWIKKMWYIAWNITQPLKTMK